MGRLFSKKERKRLLAKHHNNRDRHICDRVKALLAYDEGYEAPDISKILLISERSAYRYVEDYLKDKKLSRNYQGSQSKLNEKQAEELIAHLEKQTYCYVKDIVVYVFKRYGIKYGVSGMTHWLHAQKFCYKKPQPVPAKADGQKQKTFIKAYERLKRRSGDKEPIYFADAVHPQHQSRLAYGWIRRGVKKLLPTTAKQYRVSIWGAINLNGHELEYAQCERVNEESIKQFLKQVSDKHPRAKKIHIIWDNAGYHRSKKVVDYAASLNIKLHYLPPYSPNLNPIERLWKIMHEQVTYNRYYEKFADFTEAILGFFKNIEKYETIIRSRINDRFPIINSPLMTK